MRATIARAAGRTSRSGDTLLMVSQRSEPLTIPVSQFSFAVRTALTGRRSPSFSGGSAGAFGTFRSQRFTASSSSGSGETAPSEIAQAVDEQKHVLFPRMRGLEEAMRQEDLARRGAAIPSEEWSPSQLPYKTFEKNVDPDDDDSDSDNESTNVSRLQSDLNASADGDSATVAEVRVASTPNIAKSTPQASTLGVEEIDGVQVGMEEPDLDDGLQVGMDVAEERGFYYKGPEPTLYGDWQHKGRATDF